MDKISIFKSNSDKFYIFLKKHKTIVEANLKKNFISIKSEEEPFITLDKKNINNNELEQIETFIWMVKYGFNKVRGGKYMNNNLSLKEFEEIRILIKSNLKLINTYVINTDWESDLNKCIETEKKRHINTTCFMCCKKGHFAIDCKEDDSINIINVKKKHKIHKIHKIHK